MNNIVKVTVSDVKVNELITFLINKKIYYTDLETKSNSITFKVNIGSLKLLKKQYKNVVEIKYYGFNGVKLFIKKHYLLIISFIITYLILIILSNMIFSVEIVTNNKELKDIITSYLDENKISKNKFVKSDKEINRIKKEILENNKDTLEWLEIERVGTKYIVNLTERVINKQKEVNTNMDIVAKKDALIKYLVTYKGTPLKEVNELVKKGDIIISGNIYKNEYIIARVLAEGKVFGEVWYTVTTTVPYKYVTYEPTNKKVNHIYLEIFNKRITLMGKYDTNNQMVNSKVLINKPYLFFKLIKEEKELYNYITHEVNYEEAYNEALKRSERSILDKLNEEEYIIDKKVLKINKYSSKIEVEIFYKVYENILEYKSVT